LRDKENIGLDVDTLAELDGKNAPEKIAGLPGSTGPREIISAGEQRERRATLKNMLITGADTEEIHERMAEEYNMHPAQVDALKQKMWAQMACNDSERMPFLKGLARRRIYEEIDSAKLANQFNAVASLEKTLAAIEGTLETEKTAQPSEDRMLQAVLSVIGDMKQEDITRIVMVEMKRSGAKMDSEPRILPAIDIEVTEDDDDE
jgi:hypothetical protein